MKMLPAGDRVVLRVAIITKKDDQGNETQDISREAKVVESNSADIKKGMVVYYNPRGCINVEAMSTKKYVFLIADACDIYGIVKYE